MLDRLSDIYRIINPTPSDDLIVQRKAAITAFLPKLGEDASLPACVDLVSFGLPQSPNSAQRSFATAIVSAIRDHQPSFPSDIAQQPIDLRLFATVALAEYLVAADEPDSAIMAASLLLSATETRGPGPHPRIDAEVAACAQIARSLLREKAQTRRQREDWSPSEIKGPDLANLILQTRVALAGLWKASQDNAGADREELNVLWWVIGNRSNVLATPFPQLPVQARIAAAASDLAALVVPPPPPAAKEFLASVLGTHEQCTLGQLVAGWPREVLEVLASDTTTLAPLLESHPAIVPLTWLAKRRVDSDLSPGWEVECEKRVFLSAAEKKTALDWATQLFNERIVAQLSPNNK